MNANTSGSTPTTRPSLANGRRCTAACSSSDTAASGDSASSIDASRSKRAHMDDPITGGGGIAGQATRDREGPLEARSRLVQVAEVTLQQTESAEDIGQEHLRLVDVAIARDLGESLQRAERRDGFPVSPDRVRLRVDLIQQARQDSRLAFPSFNVIAGLVSRFP